MRHPRCAVIVLNFNGEDMLGDCLASLRAQTCRDFTVMVVDNGSTDGSADFVQSHYPEFTLLAQGRNLGFCAGNNLAIRRALERGFRYVFLLNNDATCAPSCLERMLQAVEEDERIAAVCPKIYIGRSDRLWFAGGDFNLWTARARHRGWKAHDHGQFDRAADITLATGCALLLRCSALREVGLLDERFFAYLEDVEWSVRALRAGYRLRFVPQAVVWHQGGATSVKQMGGGSQSFPQRLSSRNLVLLACKHLRPLQWPTFFLGACWFYLGFFSCLRIWRRDWRALRAIYTGLWEGMRLDTSGAGAASDNAGFVGNAVPH